MQPTCTATCEERELLTAAIEALATGGICPMLPGGPLHDEIRVSLMDPECYRNVAFETCDEPQAFYAEDGKCSAADACRTCVREALEEQALEAREGSKPCTSS